MTPNQEEALYDFLENAVEPFTLKEISAYVRLLDFQWNNRLPAEIALMINSRNIAFPLDDKQWISRRAFFEPCSFIISPSRLELLNGILIPGHRCVPFANPAMMPQDYVFHWKGEPVKATTTEGPPNEFYPYYCVYGEEYAVQYIAKDNPENEESFNSDPYEDPPEVSIHTLDMRHIYREASFVPGDSFIVRNLDWKRGLFELEKANKSDWDQNYMDQWVDAAEKGFEKSFSTLGPGISTEEQIAYAYWYGDKRMRESPAWSLEEFLFEKTENIDCVQYGIETRFWFKGKEIPDVKELKGFLAPPDKTPTEDILIKNGVPISEYVIHAYIRDALFRNESDIDNAINRLIPPVIDIDQRDFEHLALYMSEAMGELGKRYSYFADHGTGPIRQRVGELHTAVITLSVRLQKGEIELTWLPQHTFIILSQIQGYAASLLEDLGEDDMPPDIELDAIDNSLDSMIETFEDVRELIDNSLDNFRKNNLVVIRGGAQASQIGSWRAIQISVSGTDVWRRVNVPETCTLEELHHLIQCGLDWRNISPYRFVYEKSDMGTTKKEPSSKTRIGKLCDEGVAELLYEYGTKWTVKIIILQSYQPAEDEATRFVAGAGTAPPEEVSGPLRYRRILAVLEGGGSDLERQAVLEELGADYVHKAFDLEKCNTNIGSAILAGE